MRANRNPWHLPLANAHICFILKSSCSSRCLVRRFPLGHCWISPCLARLAFYRKDAGLVPNRVNARYAPAHHKSFVVPQMRIRACHFIQRPYQLLPAPWLWSQPFIAYELLLLCQIASLAIKYIACCYNLEDSFLDGEWKSSPLRAQNYLRHCNCVRCVAILVHNSAD